MKHIKKIRNSIFIAAIFLFSFSHAHAANLYVEVSDSNVSVNETITASVYVNSQGEPVNNVEGVISVNDSLQIVSVSSASSDLNLWVEQPTVSGNRVSFNGGVANPGYSGSRGRVVSLTLRSVKNGTGVISFNSASVRLNDGLGTDALNSKTGASITIAEPVKVEPVPTVETTDKKSTTDVDGASGSSNKNLAPLVVNSDQTPDSDKWYKTDSTTLDWDLPSGVIAMKTLFDNRSSTDASILYNNAFKTKTINELEDGIWYFHIKYQTNNGWSPVTHKKIQIDNSEPEVSYFDYKVLESDLVRLNISAEDEFSGVEKIILDVDGKNKVDIFKSEEDIEYTFSSDYFGEKTVSIEVFDKAGNSNYESIVIDFPKVDVPLITSYTDIVEEGDQIVVSGSSTYVDSDIEIYIQTEDGEIEKFKTTTDASGNFSYSISNLNYKGSGALSAWVQVLFDDETQIISSEKVSIEIKGKGVIEYLSEVNQKMIVFMPTIIVLFILILLAYIASKNLKDRRIYWEKRKRLSYIRKEAMDLVNAFKNSIDVSVDQAKLDINTRDIAEIENDILKELLDNFKDTEKLISSKIKRVKRPYKRKNIDSDII